MLGPLEVRRDGVAVDLGPLKQRALLIRLLVAAGQVVSADRLIDDLWGTEAPPGGDGIPPSPTFPISAGRGSRIGPPAAPPACCSPALLVLEAVVGDALELGLALES